MLLLLAVLKFALSSPLGAQQAKQDAAQLSALLSDVLHQPVEASVVPHDDLPQMLAQGKIDFAWLSASQYVRAVPSVPVAKLLRGGLPFYRSAIFVRKGTVKRLTDLKGKRLAFVSEQSGAGYLLALRVLLGAGFAEPDLRYRTFLGDHAAVCKAVLEGEADAGATFANDGRGGALAGCVETLGARAKGLKVLATSDPIPNDVIAARPGAPTELVTSLRTALLSLASSPPGREQLNAVFHADGFVPADDADYAVLRPR
ncbi:MAG: phosphate/phosphite/phosphonate ABC transporter substrate-binding protein [Myxococcales bacterium]